MWIMFSSWLDVSVLIVVLVLYLRVDWLLIVCVG
jgi:hypothetical protein